MRAYASKSRSVVYTGISRDNATAQIRKSVSSPLLGQGGVARSGGVVCKQTPVGLDSRTNKTKAQTMKITDVTLTKKKMAVLK